MHPSTGKGGSNTPRNALNEGDQQHTLNNNDNGGRVAVTPPDNDAQWSEGGSNTLCYMWLKETDTMQATPTH